MEYFAPIGLALSFGIGTAMAPCPMATNIAAISFIGRRVDRPSQVLLAGLLYALGRSLAYVALAILLAATVVSDSAMSAFLESYMNELIGPLLIVIAMVLLEMITLNFGGSGISEKMQKRVEVWGIWAAFPLGVAFALAFCPPSALCFFGSVWLLAKTSDSMVVVPSIYGIGTALPVVAFAVLIAFSAQSLGKAFNVMTQVEWWMRRVAGTILLVVGILFSLEYCLGIPLLSSIRSTVGV
jgi:cytochrome c-type biogenesis protein